MCVSEGDRRNMRFLNFDLRAPNNTVELQGLGLNWELHNFADFEVLRLMLADEY